MKLSKVTAASLVVLTGLTLSTTAVHAEEVGAFDTHATFELKAGDGGPTDPLEPIDPVEPPMTGPLRIDAVSSFNFGSVKLGEGKGVYEAIKTIDEETQKESVLGLQVTDSRGTGVGWSVGVKISDFDGKIPSNILKGAEVTIPKGSLKTNSADDKKAPITVGVSLTKESTPIFTAEKDTGMGTWANLFEGSNEKVTLTVPEGNYADQYSADITWTLQNAPK
ncbi:WxL domain-containing protein [Carnobacterium maltaromaticum]|uniref:WxL domain-containing protein n=1 Tax=Carnobacterium maltaromaticum TaxID=2751 RepID=A0AAW9JWK7_CARML|nr:WxL domain-containing protein [Carnobacterium maltaromaticum]MDZ5759993.1 WxL domain-containing protein [Carnobacterium maltaromaticum]